MIRLLLLLFLLTACSSPRKKNGDEQLLSAIISRDSVILYTGLLTPGTPYQKIAMEEQRFKQLLKDKIRSSGEPLTVLLKLSSEGGSGGILDQVDHIRSWSQELGITKFSLSEGDSMDVVRFNVDTRTWRLIDSMLANPPKLVMPREENAPPGTSPDPPVPVQITTPVSVVANELPGKDAFLIEIRNDNTVWYCPLSAAKAPLVKVRKPVKETLAGIIKSYEAGCGGVPQRYLIKGDEKAGYPVFEQVTQALEKNHINKYELITSLDQ